MALWDYSEPDEKGGLFFLPLANFSEMRTSLHVPTERSSSSVDLFDPLQSSILSGICIFHVL